MRSESIKRLRLVAVRGAFPALACVVAYAVTPARADALPDPVEEVPRQLAFSGYAEVAGSPAQGTRRVRHIVWADATTNTYANALFIEEKDETFAGGVFTATLDDCTFQPKPCVAGNGQATTLAQALRNQSTVYVTTEFCERSAPTGACEATSSFKGVPTGKRQLSTSLFALATPSQRLIGVWQSTASAACTAAGVSETAISQHQVTLNLPEKSRLEVSFSVAAKWHTGLNASSSGLVVGVGPATQSTVWSGGTPRIVWTVNPWPQSRVGRAATDLRGRTSSTYVTGAAFATHAFSVAGVAAGAQTIMLSAATVGTSDGEVDICGRGSTARAMAEETVLTVLAYAE